MKDIDIRKDAFLAEFAQVQDAMSALGDQTRQCIIIALIKSGGSNGLRVGELQKEANVSRTALSHHLKVLLEANLISVAKRGTMNFYKLDGKSQRFYQLIHFWLQVEEMMELCRNHQRKG